MNDKKKSYLNGSTIELHYGLKNQSHSMDAIVQNKCELEFLTIIGEISRKFNSKIIVETEPFGEGGLRRWFTIVSGTENNKGVITTALVVALATGIIVTPIASATSEIARTFIERLFEDDEMKILLKDKLEEEIKNLKLDAELKIQQLSESKTITKRRSNFYLALQKYPKTDKVSFSIEDKDKTVQEEINVQRSDFDKYITFSEELDPIIDENAVIEIISPILIKGDYKWRGIYNGETLFFNMKSNEFKTLVQTGMIEFKNGSTINCVLEINRKMSNGEEVITGYDIISVNTDTENDSSLQISKE